VGPLEAFRDLMLLIAVAAWDARFPIGRTCASPNSSWEVDRITSTAVTSSTIWAGTAIAAVTRGVGVDARRCALADDGLAGLEGFDGHLTGLVPGERPGFVLWLTLREPSLTSTKVEWAVPNRSDIASRVE